LIPSHAAFVLFLRFVIHLHAHDALLVSLFSLLLLLLCFRSGRMIALFMLIATLVMILICVQIFLIIMTNWWSWRWFWAESPCLHQ
jgi:hypothetical protein